jgi:hypothetical protein
MHPIMNTKIAISCKLCKPMCNNARIGRDTLQNRAEVPNFPLGRHFLPANVVSALFSLPARFRAVISGTNLRH